MFFSSEKRLKAAFQGTIDRPHPFPPKQPSFCLRFNPVSVDMEGRSSWSFLFNEKGSDSGGGSREGIPEDGE